MADTNRVDLNRCDHERHIATEQATILPSWLLTASDNAGLALRTDLIIVLPTPICFPHCLPGAGPIGPRRGLSTAAAVFCALAVGCLFITAGSSRFVLVVGADNLSKFVNWEDRSTCVLFGDAAGAVVLGPAREGSGFTNFKLRADGSGGPLLKLPAGGSRLPASRETVENKLHYIQMNGREVFKFAVRVMSEVTEEVLSAGDSVKTTWTFYPPPGQYRIINAAARRLNCLGKFWSTSTATATPLLPPFPWPWKKLRGGRIKEGDNIVLAGFRPG